MSHSLSQPLSRRCCLLIFFPMIFIFLLLNSATIHFSGTSNSLKKVLGYFDLQNVTSATEPTLVLLWDIILGANEVMDDEKFFDKCPQELNCVVTQNRSLLEESDAVLIRLRAFNWKQLPENMTRRDDQYFIMAEWESPKNTKDVDISGHDGFFNLTMTFRHDSDIVWPYGDFGAIPDDQKNETEFDQNMIETENVVKNKTKLIAWFASNCYYVTSNRGKFVDDFRKYAPVDAYGACGNLTCPKICRKTCSRSSDDCLEMLTRDYKFYLSLENSICTDYVTEKFFNMLTTVTIIPIVFKRKMILNMIKDEEIAQAFNKSFIAIDDFGTLEEMADYLKYLDKNITAYMEYFQWKANYRIVLDRTTELPACKLCRIIKEKKQHVVPNIQKWWHDGGKCQSYVTADVAKFKMIGST